jgi:hypothetical protein
VATAADIVAGVRDATHQIYADGAGPVTDAGILRMTNELYPLVRRKIARIVPDWFTTVSADLVVAAGAVEIDVSALTTLDLVFEVRRLQSGSSSPARYRTVQPAGPDPEGSPVLCWQRRGLAGAGTALELYPVALAPGTYRVRYLATAPTLAGTGAVLLPAGGEGILVEEVAGRVKQDKLERDGSGHVARAQKLLKEFAAGMGLQDFVAFPPRG